MRSQWLLSHQNSMGRQIIAALLSTLVAYGIRLLFLNSHENLVPLHLTFGVSMISSVLSVMVIRSLSKYPGTESVSSIIPAVSISYGLLMAILLIGRIDYARGMLFSSYVLCCVVLFVQQLVWPERTRLRIAVVKGGAAQRLALNNVDWCDVADPSENLDHVDALTVDLRADLDDAWERRIAELALAGVPIYHIKHLQESISGRVELEHLSETSYGTLSPPTGYIITKRCIDTLVAVIAMVLLLPLFVVVAALVRLDSPGPAIFRQRRIGFRGRPFVVCKFRTMRMSGASDDSRDAAMTRDSDERITRVGHFLRKTRLDELPQLINVVRGEMSLIGPRPEAEILSKWYEQEIPFYRYRHIVLPGVTGWAQINQGHVTDVRDVTSKLHYDFYYIKNISPWIDALIAIRTMLIMVSGHGAR